MLHKNVRSLTILPSFLIVFFVAENHIFNIWLHVVPNNYWVRCSLAALSLGILVYGISLFLQSRVLRHWYLLITSCIVSLILISEFLYYSYSTSFLQVSALRYAGQVFSVSGTISTLLTPKLLLFLVPPIIVIFFCFIIRSEKTVILTQGQKVVVGIFIILLSMSGYGWLAAAETRDFGSTKGLFSSPYDTNALVGKMGVVNYFLEGVIKYAWHSNDVTTAEKTFVREWNRSRPERAPQTTNFGIAKDRNLILIQVESLENAVINAVIEGQEVTPHLNSLAKNGAYFSNYFTQIGHGTTADTEFMILNSLYSLPDSVAFVDYPQNSYRALPHFLINNGYSTLVLHGDVATFWNRSNIYPQLGYQQWFMKNDFTIPREIGYQGLGDADFFSQSAEKLKDVKKPFMATLITLSSHTPFLLPNDLRTIKLSDKNNLTETQRHYLESIHYTDAAIGAFLDDLKKSGLYDNSLILIYGDHGSFTDIGAALNADKKLPPTLARQHVPLIILAPGTHLKSTSSSPASHIDIYPTVANLLGFSVPRSALGQDLFTTQAPVMTYRKPSTKNIGYILSDRLSYAAAKDGIFEHGSCTDTALHPLPAENCRELFEAQSATLKVSDTVIRANMLNAIASETTHE